MSEMGGGSVTNMLRDLKAGDSSAFGPLWDRYFLGLVRLADAKLRAAAARRSDADGEDAAVSAMGSFWNGVENRRFAKLDNRDDLAQVLSMITLRKVLDHLRRHRAKRRGGGRELLNVDLSADDGGVVNRILAREPTAELAMMLAEGFESLLSKLNDELRRIALLSLDGYTIEQIGAQLGCCSRTVDFKLALTRRIWEEAAEHERSQAL